MLGLKGIVDKPARRSAVKLYAAFLFLPVLRLRVVWKNLNCIKPRIFCDYVGMC